MFSSLDELLKLQFEIFGIKQVSYTDKSKSAYVLNSSQVKVLEAAGISPSLNRPADPFQVKVLFDKISTVAREAPCNRRHTVKANR